MFRILSIVLSIIILINCAGHRHVKRPRMKFPEDIYAYIPKVSEKKGTAVITGQAFLKTRGGDVKFAAGDTIVLNPVTIYSDEWYNRAFLHGEYIGDPDSRIWDYIYKTIADGNGRFKFKNIPKGEYYINTAIFWEYANGTAIAQMTGSQIVKKITVTDEPDQEFILSN